MPSLEEMRAMTWMAIAGGANGIIGYSYFDLKKFKGAEADLSDTEKQALFLKRWETLKQVASDIAPWIPVMLSVEQPLAIEPDTAHAPEVAFRLYAKDGVTYLLLVNTTLEPQTAVFRLPPGTQSQDAQIPVSDNVLSVPLQGLQNLWVPLR